MRRTRLAAIVLLVRLALAVALVPLVAYAMEAGSSYEGVYEGIAEGTGTDGGGGSTAVTVWVEDEGDTARFTIELAEYGIIVATEGQVTNGEGAISVPVSVDSMGVKGDATLILENSGGTWRLTGTGQGQALGYEGSGSLTAERVTEGISVPALGKQFGAMLSNLTGGPSGATSASAEEKSAATDVGAITKGGSLALAEPEPPLADDDKLLAAGLAAVVLILQIVLA